MRIYTRKGDAGQTQLADGTPVSKTDPRIAAYGAIDELNAHVGLLVAVLPESFDATLLEHIQQTLFCVGTHLPSGRQPVAAYESETIQIEAAIEELQAPLPPLRSFVLPGGCQAAAQAHVCRTVCRRAECALVQVASHGPLAPSLLAYVNRLSDYFFSLARNLNFIAGHTEKTWHNTCK